MDPSANPAQRLHRLLSNGKSLRPEIRGQRSRDVLAELLLVDPPTDSPMFHRRLAKLYQLPGLIKDRIESLADNPNVNQDHCLRWYPAVDEAFSLLNLLSVWGDFIDRVNDTHLFSLEVCSQALSLYDADPLADLDQLRALLEQVRSLVDEIVQSDLETDLKRFLLGHLRRIEEAIQDYQVSGIEPLREALFVTMGNVARNSQKATRWSAHAVWTSFSDIVRTAAAVVTLMVHGHRLLGFDDVAHHGNSAPQAYIEIIATPTRRSISAAPLPAHKDPADPDAT